jgi:cell division protease FtsH
VPERPRPKPWTFIGAYILLAILVGWYIHVHSAASQTKEVTYSDFESEVAAGHLQEVDITQSKLIGLLKKGQSAKAKQAQAPQMIECTRIPGLDAGPLVQELQAQHVKFSGTIHVPSPWTEMLLVFGPMLLIFAFFAAVLWRAQQRRGGPLSFGRNRAKIHDQSAKNKTKFSDVAGVEEAKAELLEVTDFLTNPEKYQKLGARIPKGVLLVGPPGTGKTLLARAVAGEANVPFFSISGSEFVEMFVGVGASRVRDLFEQAKQRSPCIVFIDELDAIGKSRASRLAMVSNDEREQTLNQLLVEMDGFDPRSTVIIMAATNRPEVLDQALLRPGRFDRQVVLDRPDIREREAILRLHARKLKVSSAADLHGIAAETPGMVGADLANIVNEAALNAARRNADQIDMRDFENAVDRVTLGFEKKGRLISHEEKQRVAFHESGHALVALTVPNAEPLRRISIVPRAMGSLGHTLQFPEKDRYLYTEEQLNDRIAVLLGGRGAEELVYKGVVSTGSSDDLEQATRLAREMVTRFGMSKQLGNVTYGLSREAQYLKSPLEENAQNYSEQTAEQIDLEIRAKIEAAYRRVSSILSDRRLDLDRLSTALIRQETLERSAVDELLKAAVGNARAHA